MCIVCKNCTKLIIWIHIYSHKKLLDYLYFLMNSIFELEIHHLCVWIIFWYWSFVPFHFWQTLMKNCNFRWFSTLYVDMRESQCWIHSIPRCWPVLKQFYCTISRLHSFMTLIIIISRFSFFLTCSLDDDIYFTKSTFNSFSICNCSSHHSPLCAKF